MKQFYFNVGRFFVLTLFLFLGRTGFSQVYTVTSIADDGSLGTLRDAINQVNAGSFKTIDFNFSLLGTGPYTISLIGDLPTLAPAGGAHILIDGFSEPSSVSGPIGSRTITVQLDGALAANNGLNINASNIEIDGLAIYSCNNNGILVQGGNSTISIWGNFIGTDATGLSTGLGNGNTGITVNSFASVTSNSSILIGVKGDGTANDANEGNLVVANGSSGAVDGGIVLFNTTTSRFAGNIIGLGKDGVTKTNLFNLGTGLLLSDRCTFNTVGTNGDGVSDALERNFISNNARAGIWLFSKSNNNVISNNVIGLDAASGDAFNINFGINIDNSSNNLVGTSANGVSEVNKPNYISNNKSGGIQIKSGNISPTANQNADNNVIAGNFIGVALDGSTPAGNRADGITIISYTDPFTSNNNIIGSDGSGVNEQYKPNLIGYYSFNGITLNDLSNTNQVTGNRISKNSIFGNGTTAIDEINAGQVGTTEQTPNQAGGFSATGPNALLNFPVVTAASATGSNITISGFARPGAILEFYISDRTATIPSPPSPLLRNFGQGKSFLFQALQGGTLNGITDGGTNVAGSYSNIQEGFAPATGPDPVNTDFTFSFTLPAASVGITAAGTYTITALAIDAGNTSGNANNTSSFSVDFDADFTALPITLIDFTGHESGGKVYLNWSTSREVDNVSFEIQRSANGVDFSTIGKVPGSLTTSEVKNYSFTDPEPLPGVSFYRLKQTDIDGHFTFSKVLTMRTDLTAEGIKIFPSPFHDNLNVNVYSKTNDQIQIRMIDQSGRIVARFDQQASAGVNAYNLNAGLTNLLPGVYIVDVSGKTISYQQRVAKY
jgi:parallel beta-helix repeat protein